MQLAGSGKFITSKLAGLAIDLASHELPPEGGSSISLLSEL